MENLIAFQPQGVEAFTYLPQAWTRSFAKPIVHPARVMAGEGYAAQCLGSLITQVESTEAPSQALANSSPFEIEREIRVIPLAQNKAIILARSNSVDVDFD